MAGRSVLVLDVVGLTPKQLAGMPALRRLGDIGFQATLDTVLPAVTCSVQSTLLTGALPAEHGIVGNGWYFRELGEVLMWRQSNALVGGEKVWDAGRRRGSYRVANLCWWYAMNAATDLAVTPRPVYHADGRKSPDCYTNPPEVHDELTARFGPFPLFNYWGPTASIASSRWIARAAAHLLTAAELPDLTLVYLPHLDYALQRYGPDGPAATAAATELDAEIGPLVDLAHERGATVVALSEYGITAAHRPVDLNRELRRAGLLRVYTQADMEYLDPCTSAAFAVADHQVAHIYVNNPAVLSKVLGLVRELPGVDLVLDAAGKRGAGLDHPRAGELVAVAEPGCWFTYYYWLDDDRAPDFARIVDIHRKPGYDPAELFFDPRDRSARLRAAAALLKKKIGLRYLMNVVPLDPSCVRGSHGRLPDSTADAPVLLCDDPAFGRERFAATDVKALLLNLGRAPSSKDVYASPMRPRPPRP